MSNCSASVDLAISHPPSNALDPWVGIVEVRAEFFENGSLHDDVLVQKRYHFASGGEMADLAIVKRRITEAFNSGIDAYAGWSVDTSGSDGDLNTLTHREAGGMTRGQMDAAKGAVHAAMIAFGAEIYAQELAYSKTLADAGDSSAALDSTLINDAVIEVPEPAPPETVAPAPEANAAAAA